MTIETEKRPSERLTLTNGEGAGVDLTVAAFESRFLVRQDGLVFDTETGKQYRADRSLLNELSSHGIKFTP